VPFARPGVAFARPGRCGLLGPTPVGFVDTHVDHVDDHEEPTSLVFATRRPSLAELDLLPPGIHLPRVISHLVLFLLVLLFLLFPRVSLVLLSQLVP